ncbi:unnamed protein product [Diplocarpon coronariae]
MLLKYTLVDFPTRSIIRKRIIVALFKSSLRSIRITLKLVPIEAYHSINKVERYYRPLKRTFKIIIAKYPYVYLATKEEGESQFTLKGNILYYSLTKYKRVTRAILASELYAIVAGINILVSIATTIDIVIAKLSLPYFPTIIYIDSLSLYKYIIKLGNIKEKQLIIDIIAIRQSYENRELIEIH